MSAASLPYYWYLRYLSAPASDRPLFGQIEGGKVRTILEIGIGDATRTLRMFEVALRHRPAGELAYYGIDLFEDRPGGGGLPLKTAHRRLRETGIRCRLIPGDPHGALARTANEIRQVDFVVIAADQEAESLAKAWKYLPRVLAPDAAIWHEVSFGSETEFRQIGLDSLGRLIDSGRQATPLRRAA